MLPTLSNEGDFSMPSYLTSFSCELALPVDAEHYTGVKYVGGYR
jgi:hypothetical protein